MVNDVLNTYGAPETPWGGVKQSGIGRTHSDDGLRDLCQTRHVNYDRLALAARALVVPVQRQGRTGRLLQGDALALRALVEETFVKTVDKPWGHELIWAETDRYVGKILHIESGESLSLAVPPGQGRDGDGAERAVALRALPRRRGAACAPSSRRASRSTSRPGCATA